jgi:hypothetical protein
MVEDPFEGAHVIVTTHDEIVLECPEEVAEEALRWLLGHMREAEGDHRRRDRHPGLRGRRGRKELGKLGEVGGLDLQGFRQLEARV